MMIRFACSLLSGATAEVELPLSATILNAKEHVAPSVGVPALAMSLHYREQVLDNGATLESAGITEGTTVTASRDSYVLMYGQEVGIFSNQNSGKGPAGLGTRLDLSQRCVRREAAADEDTEETRVVLVHVGEADDHGPVRMGHEVAVLNGSRTKRLDLGYLCVTDCPAERDDVNTRLVIKRLDGANAGPVCYNQAVGIFSQDGTKRLEMSTMSLPGHDSWATRVFILALDGGQLVRDDVDCIGSHRGMWTVVD